VNDNHPENGENGVEPTASMGHDVPLAVLSSKHQLLFNYFKQLFAQVTNPPIDSLREKIVTDTTVYIGSDGDILNESPDNCRVLEINHPILTGVDMIKIKALDKPGFHTRTVSMLYFKNMRMERAIDQLLVTIDHVVEEGVNIIILSDRGVDENHVPIPSLLAVSAVEQHLVRTRKRTSVSLILESGEPRDVHQIATLLGFGARAIYPYLAHECIGELIDLGILDKDYHTAVDDYNNALLSGVVKIAAKMGISTIQSYQSARIFEAVGLNDDFIEKFFTGIVSRVGGIGIKEIEEGVMWRHNHAFDPLGLAVDTTLDSSGFHSLRSGKDKEDHLYSPETIIKLQRAVRDGSYEEFRENTDLVDDERRPHTLRGLMDFVWSDQPVPLEEVEPVSSIVKRFKTSAMSFGALSEEAHETLAIAMNSIGARSNTGEGGEAVERYGTIKNSAIKQVASGRFGVTSAYLNSAQEIQIKMAQGAKPGEGGNLPGKKVYPWIARTRCSTPGVQLISPPPHHDIYSIEDLAQLIYDLKNANRDASISVKLVSENGVGTIASGVAKAGAQVILISGYDGGTGAAPINSIHNAGLPWELGISEVHQSLIENGLRSRVLLETDGKLMTGRDVAIAALLGAEEFSFGTAPLICMGCMMMRACSKDTCPVGIATQNKELRKRFRGKPEHVVNFMYFVAQQLREIMAKLGCRTVEEMIGHTDKLKVRDNPVTKRAGMVDLSKILDPKYSNAPKSHFDPKDVYDFKLEKTLDDSVLIPAFRKADQNGMLGHTEPLSIKVSSTDRAFGTMLGSVITRKYKDTLPDDSFIVNAQGGGGQSFGAFIPKGLTIRLTGDSRMMVSARDCRAAIWFWYRRRREGTRQANIIVGNVALYGATSGKAYICGMAGERFCIRNSGATAVVRGLRRPRTGIHDARHGRYYRTDGQEPGGRHERRRGLRPGPKIIHLYKRTNKDMAELEELRRAI
jgi:glutamate synthase (NADPH/NADH) large chain